MTEKPTKTKTKTKTEAKTKTKTKTETPAKEFSGDAPSGYHRGENQKDITDSYRKNWKSIFAKKPPRSRPAAGQKR